MARLCFLEKIELNTIEFNMNEISIVTAFFDIGRSDWTPDKGLPHYLQRTTDTYFDRFANMANLDNTIVVYTSEDLAEKVWSIRKNKEHKTVVITIDFEDQFIEQRDSIRKVQNNPEYLAKINPSQIKNPEYWSADYVLVNMLKSHFVNHAIGAGVVDTDLVAWLDFGYCREPSTLNDVTLWQYPFDKEKIHFFNIKEYNGTSLTDIIANNDVHVTGPMIVASQKMWPELERLVDESFKELISKDLIDDDQTLLLMSSLKEPEKFELHPILPNDWFIAFKEYNENIS
jgi:protein YibB